MDTTEGQLMGRRPKKPGAVTRLRERTKPSGKIYYYYDAGGKPRKEVPLGSDYGLAIMKYAELERDRNADNLAEKVVTLATCRCSTSWTRCRRRPPAPRRRTPSTW